MVDRYAIFRRFHITLEWPAFNDATLANAMRWMIVVVALAALAWLYFGVWRHRGAEKATADPDSRTT
jgi:hypothetical protein